MAVLVEVLAIQPSGEPAGGQPYNGSMNVALNSDYDAPVPLTLTLYGLPFEGAHNRNEAIAQVLVKLDHLIDQMKAGIAQAAATHPIGG